MYDKNILLVLQNKNKVLIIVQSNPITLTHYIKQI